MGLDVIRDQLRALVQNLPLRVIPDLQGRPYLSRWTLHDPGDGTNKGRKVYIHCFHQSDQDRELHNHPWDESTTTLLWGGYTEYRWNPATKTVDTRQCITGSQNVIRHDTFHRVELTTPEVWTLFITGNFVARWGFLDVATATFTDYEDYLKARGQTTLEEDY